MGPDEESTWYLRRLDGGLFVLQTVDYILGWICMEDDGVCVCILYRSFGSYKLYIQIRDHVTMILGRKNKTLKDIVAVLKEYRNNVGEETRMPDDQAPSQQEILQGLIEFLEGC